VPANAGNEFVIDSVGLKSLSINHIAAENNNVFVATNGSGLFYSNNNGTSFTTINNGLTVTSFSYVVKNNNKLYAFENNGKINVSNNNGTNWTVLNAGNGQPAIGVYINMDTIVILNPNQIIYSHNAGASFNTANGILPTVQPWQITSNNAGLYATINGMGVVKSTDHGASWVSTGNTNIMGMPMYGGIAGKDNLLYVGTSNGLYQLDNTTNSFNLVYTPSASMGGMVPIFHVLINANNKVYFSPDGYGVFSNDNSPAGINDFQIIKQNSFNAYPNPITNQQLVVENYVNETQQFKLINTVGKIMMQFEVNKTASINLQNITTGIYYLVNQQQQTITIIKQ
jgi:hypothetical protein